MANVSIFDAIETPKMTSEAERQMFMDWVHIHHNNDLFLIHALSQGIKVLGYMSPSQQQATVEYEIRIQDWRLAESLPIK